MNESTASQIRQNEAERKLRDMERQILPPEKFRVMFPHASKSARAANLAQNAAANPLLEVTSKNNVTVIRAAASGVRQRKPMNRTEESFLAVLRGAFPQARIDREGITLRWPDGMTYTPDFVAWMEFGAPVLFETKGPFIRRTGLEKFRAARAHWPCFRFEMWQRDAAYQWRKIL